MITNILIRLASFSFQKCLVFSAILGGIYYFTAFDDGSSIQAKIQETESKVKEQEDQAQKSEAALKEVEQVRATVGALSEQFKTVSNALPSEVMMADIIRTVDFVSRKSGVSIKTKEPKAVINRDYYEEIPLRITLEGTYAEITTFLFYLASTERIMKVNNFVMSMPSSAGKGFNPSRLLFEGQVISYRFIGNQAAAASGKGAPAAGGAKK
jgi:type IV pilus assembly protein PilO